MKPPLNDYQLLALKHYRAVKQRSLSNENRKAIEILVERIAVIDGVSEFIDMTDKQLDELGIDLTNVK